MATSQEILDILLQLRASGLSEGEAVNAILAETGSEARAAGVQVQALTDSHKEHVQSLQTLNTYYDQHGQALSKAEQRYADLQLSSKELSVAERDLTRDGIGVARMAGTLGSEGGELAGRMSALGGIMGSGGALGIGIGAAIVGLGAAVEAGRSMAENADKNESAQKGLAQAFDSQGKNVRDYQGQIDTFLTKNSRFISDQYDAKEGIAALTRAGFDWNTTQRLMTDALDLAAVKNISFSQATDILVRARSGDARALRDLGIASKSVEDPEKELAKAQAEVRKATDEHSSAVKALTEWEEIHSNRSKLTQADLVHEQDLKDKVTKSTSNLTLANDDLTGAQAAVKDKGDKFNVTLDLLESRTHGAHEKTSDLAQSSNDLHNQWDSLSNKVGPDLNKQLEHMSDDLADVVGWVDRNYGTLKGWVGYWETLSNLDFGNWEQAVGKWIGAGGAAQGSQGGFSPSDIPSGGYRYRGGRAGGGSVGIGEAAWVGEEGPELLSVTSSGARVTSSGDSAGALGKQTALLEDIKQLLSTGRGGGNQVTVYASGGDSDGIARAVGRQIAQVLAS